jgi:hypothetical protein
VQFPDRIVVLVISASYGDNGGRELWFCKFWRGWEYENLKP